MSFSDFNKQAKDKFEDYRPEIDAEALWSQLEPQVPKKKDKKRFFFWLFLGGLAIGLAAFGFWYAMPNTATPNPAPTKTPVAKQKIDIAQNKSSNISSTNLEEKEINPEAVIQGNLATTETKSDNETSDNSISTTYHSKTTPPIISPKGTTKNIIKAPTSPQLAVQEEEKKTETPKALPPATQINEARETLNAKSLAALALFDQLALKKISFPLSSSTDPKPLTLAKPEPESQAIIAATPNKWQWTIGLHGGAGRLDQKLKTKETEIPIAQEVLTKGIIPLESLQGALNLQIKHRSGFYLQTGLEYNRMATLFYKQTTFSRIENIPNGIQRIYTNSITGDSTYIYGSVTQQHIQETTKNRYNNFHTLNIPLLAGYRFEYDRWSFGLEGGVLVNAYFKINGNIAGRDAEFYNLAKDHKNWFKNNLGFRPMIALNAGYQIRPDWEIYLSPQYRFPVTVSTAENPQDQSFSSLEIVAGVRFNL